MGTHALHRRLRYLPSVGVKRWINTGSVQMARLLKPSPIHILHAQLARSRIFAVVFDRGVTARHAQSFEHHAGLATFDHRNLTAIDTLVFKTSAQIVAHRIVT